MIFYTIRSHSSLNTIDIDVLRNHNINNAINNPEMIVLIVLIPIIPVLITLILILMALILAPLLLYQTLFLYLLTFLSAKTQPQISVLIVASQAIGGSNALKYRRQPKSMYIGLDSGIPLVIIRTPLILVYLIVLNDALVFNHCLLKRHKNKATLMLLILMPLILLLMSLIFRMYQKTKEYSEKTDSPHAF